MVVALYKYMQALCCSVAAAILLEQCVKAETGLTSGKSIYYNIGVFQGLESMNSGITEPKF